LYLTDTIDTRRPPFIPDVSVDPGNGGQAAPRFEYACNFVPAISKTTERLLTVLFTAGENHAGIGCDTLRPLWATEAVGRNCNFLRLSLLRQLRAKPEADDSLATDKQFALATRLADLYRQIANVPERRKVPCSQALCSTADYLVALFEPSVGSIDLETEIEPIVLPAFQRRALVLAATDLIMRSLLKVNEEPQQMQMVVALRTVGTRHAYIAVSDDATPFHTASTAGRQDGIADDMASLLTSEVVYQPFNERGVTAKITFPLHV